MSSRVSGADPVPVADAVRYPPRFRVCVYPPSYKHRPKHRAARRIGTVGPANRRAAVNVARFGSVSRLPSPSLTGRAFCGAVRSGRFRSVLGSSRSAVRSEAVSCFSGRSLSRAGRRDSGGISIESVPCRFLLPFGNCFRTVRPSQGVPRCRDCRWPVPKTGCRSLGRANGVRVVRRAFHPDSPVVPTCAAGTVVFPVPNPVLEGITSGRGRTSVRNRRSLRRTGG